MKPSLRRAAVLGLTAGIVLGLLASGALWRRAAVRRAVALQDQAAAVPVPAPEAPAPTEPDPQYAGMLAQAERETARGDHRLAAAMLMQALASRPDRPEARARLELLRTELMKTHPVVPAAPPPPPASMAAAPAEDLVSIPDGPFMMGASKPGGSADEYPAHQALPSSYSIETREVTAASYRRFCADTGRPFPRQPAWSTPQHPVVSVTWRDAQAYCRHHGRRLPTEAEWEKAARSNGTLLSPYAATSGFLEPLAWFAANSGGQAHPVGAKPPAGFGLFDAYGNVWEWVADWYSATTYDNSPERGPRGPRSGEEKVLRGGAFDSPPAAMAPTFRDKASSDSSAENRGFRCAQSRPR